MKKLQLLIVLLLFQLFFLITAQGKTEKIKGTVIAADAPMVCVWHPCAVWLIVKTEVKKQTKYVRIDVEYFPVLSLPARGFPTELTKSSKRWKFKAVRDVNKDEFLVEWVKVTDKDGNVVDDMSFESSWQLLPGAENEKLPFGEILPTYRVSANKYKLLN